jgi:hypothetical protein
MAVTVREVLGTAATLLSTELNALANNARALSSVINSNGVYDNTAGTGASATTGDGYERGYVQFVPGGAFGGAPTANTSVDVYFLKSPDGGTTFEGGGSSLTPPRSPDVSLPLTVNTAAADNTITRVCWLPSVKFKILLVNNGTGQALPASGNTIKLWPATDNVS